MAEIEAIAEAPPVPCLFNYAPSGRTPLLPLARLRELGYAIVILPVAPPAAATWAIQLGAHRDP